MMQSTIQPAIIVENLGKCYARAAKHKPRTIMEAALQGFRGLRSGDRFWALQDLNFQVQPGQMLGVLGHNGAGKSTLLQILSGIVKPDRGTVQMAGRMGALLDIGAGFHPDLTGRENVQVSAIVGGLTRKEAQAQFDAIVAFAELEDFIDNPLRTYSTGMQMRLGFSVAIHTVPDILLVDEFLSVGDLSFQTKCLDRIMTLKNNGCAIVLISHNPDQVQLLCDQALWLDHGRVKSYGDPDLISTNYKGKIDFKQQALKLHTYSQIVKIESVKAYRNLNSTPEETASIDSGAPVRFVIQYHTETAFPNVAFNLSLCDENGFVFFNTQIETTQLGLTVSPGPGEIALTLDRLDLSGGQYYVSVGAFAPDWSTTYDYRWQILPFSIHWTPPTNSILSPPQRWQIPSPHP